MDYYKQGVVLPGNVSHKCLDSVGRTIANYPGCVCFGNLTRQLPLDTKKIVVWESKSRIPYSDEAIKRWIDDLNQIGFPCHLVIKPLEIEVEVKIEEYEYKAQLFSALTLIRALYEFRSSNVPNLYFNLIDKDSTIDKFDAIQTAYKANPTSSPEYSITYAGNGYNITKQTFLDKCATHGLKVMGEGPAYINAKWNGVKWDGNGPYPDCIECGGSHH